MTIKQIVIIACDGCGDFRKYPGASTLDALRHAQELGWWRGWLKREGSQRKDPTFLCPACCARQGSNPVLIKSGGEKCVFCDGSGKCPECNQGMAWNGNDSCDECHGSGDCAACGGEGEV